MMMVHGVETIRGGAGTSRFMNSCCSCNLPACTGPANLMLFTCWYDRKRCDEVDPVNKPSPDLFTGGNWMRPNLPCRFPLLWLLPVSLPMKSYFVVREGANNKSIQCVTREPVLKIHCCLFCSPSDAVQDVLLLPYRC
jgi:hypothetical protein